MNELKRGSAPRSVSASDGVATIRDAMLLVLAEVVTIASDKYLGGQLDVQVKGAIVIIAFAAFKLAWKFITDTRRVAGL